MDMGVIGTTGGVDDVVVAVLVINVGDVVVGTPTSFSIVASVS